MRRICTNSLIIVLVGWALSARGQKPFSDSYTGIAAVVQLDSFVIIDQQEGFNVNDFIDLVQKDSSFYQAFKNLHFSSYSARHEMHFFSRKGDEKANYQATVQQVMLNDSCRKMEFLAPAKTEGDYYKRNGELRYITAKMFDKVFATHGTVCESRQTRIAEAKGLQKYYESLKTFIFQPGEQVDVPLVSKKTAIFEPDMMEYYDYEIRRGWFNDQTESYIFTVRVKEEYEEQKERKTLVKFLETHFSIQDFQVLGRTYEIVYQGLASCDVKMEVDLTYHQGVYLPRQIKYEGTWNIPGKPRETGRFQASFLDFN